MAGRSLYDGKEASEEDDRGSSREEGTGPFDWTLATRIMIGWSESPASRAEQASSLARRF